jgi:hypothetical protein
MHMPTNKPNEKYSVTVVTASGNGSETADGHATLQGVVTKAFKDVNITTPLSEFTFENEQGTAVTLQTKVSDACATTKCKIFANPKKAADA